MLVLDVGGGLGEPSRTLASEFGCAVEVLDLTEDFCPAGAAFTTRTGLSDLVSFRHGSALEIPHPDAGFDAAWTQHSSMNIADEGRLYGEIHRVLRPGGRPALHEILAGPVSPIYLLAPWARRPELNHLRPPEDVRELLEETGFEELTWIAARAPPRARRRARRDVPQPGAQPRRAQDLHRPGRL